MTAPRGGRTRPTSDRVREALFSIVGDVAGLRVLDLYAGSGALGLEALSRGAAHVTFVEKDRNALSALAANVEALAVTESVSVDRRPVERAVRDLHGPFQVVMADPPYADAARALAALFHVDEWSEPPALVVLEHDGGLNADGWPGRTEDRRRYGGTTLSFYSLELT